MSGLIFWLGLAGAEVALVVFVLLLVYWIQHSGVARRDRRAAAKMVASVRKGKADREAAITAFLSQNMGLSGPSLKTLKTAILREEFRLLQRFADVYRRRDSGAAAQFQLSYEAAVAPYLELHGGGKVTKAAEGDADIAELEALQAENQRLSEELSVTMDTMSRILSEYSTMFGEGATADAQEAADEDVDTEQAMPAEELPQREVAELDESELDITEDTVSSEQGGADSAQHPAEEGVSEDTEAEESGSIGAADKQDAMEIGEPEPAPSAELTSVADTDVVSPAESESAASEPPAAKSAAELVEPDEIDELIEADPLEEGLGSLFDDDEIAVLDDESADAADSPKDDGAIAI